MPLPRAPGANAREEARISNGKRAGSSGGPILKEQAGSVRLQLLRRKRILLSERQAGLALGVLVAMAVKCCFPAFRCLELSGIWILVQRNTDDERGDCDQELDEWGHSASGGEGETHTPPTTLHHLIKAHRSRLVAGT